MNYQEMSDRSIDLAVFQTIFGKDVFTKDADLRRARERGISYCNSWADAGPIAHQNKINLYFSNNENMAEHRQTGKESVTCTDYNPCRAICIVLLMMKGGE